VPWSIVQHKGQLALLNLDLVFAYVPRENGKARAVTIAGATLDLDDDFADILAAAQEEDEDEGAEGRHAASE
jgi:hypothetical protein